MRVSFFSKLSPVLLALCVAAVAPAVRAQTPTGTASPSGNTTPGGTTTTDSKAADSKSGDSDAKRGAALPVIDPVKDGHDLADQGKDQGKDAKKKDAADDPMQAGEIFSEDWWSRSRPIFELHGYFRTRGELLHNFNLGRHNTWKDPDDKQNLWPQPLDHSYTDSRGNVKNLNLCGSSGTDTCTDPSQASANMRLRMVPELHISDNLRIVAQIDALDNLILGSTPDSYTLPQSNPGYASTSVINGYAPLGAFSTSQSAPTAGVNSYRNSVEVKRAWAEFATPLGQLRFGRMPNHWGLGMLYNAGDGIDSDYQTNIDRIMFTTGIKSVDLYFGGSWDFISTGPTSQSAGDVNGGQPYNTANRANVGQWSAFIFRKQHADLQKLSLAHGEVVINGGLFASYRTQELDIASSESSPIVHQLGTDNSALVRRGVNMLIPDAWFQLLFDKFRFEAEFAAIVGSIEKPQDTTLSASSVDIRQFGLATETEFRAIEDKLRLNFGFGWSSGDPWAASLNPGSNGLTPGNNGQAALTTFRFNPAYNVDNIFFRRILSRVEGAYYFRPAVEYDFLRSPGGQKFGGGAMVLWSRASEPTQAPGHASDLGLELGVHLYFQAKDGTLNDDPKKTGGFYTMLQYGAFFPFKGLEYLDGQKDTNKLANWDLSTAQFVRLFLGVVY